MLYIFLMYNLFNKIKQTCCIRMYEKQFKIFFFIYILYYLKK